MLIIANVEQAAAWDGPEGDHWTEHAERDDRTIRRHRARLMNAGMITTIADVLDIGCGTGPHPGGGTSGVDRISTGRVTYRPRCWRVPASLAARRA